MNFFNCEICSQHFNTKQNLLKHQNKKFNCSIITPFKCNSCNKYFRNNKNLIKHTENKICTENVINNIVNDFIDNDLKMAISSCINSSLNNETKTRLLSKYNNKLTNEEILIIIESDMSSLGKVNMIFSLLTDENII
jgi:hypothetical protein